MNALARIGLVVFGGTAVVAAQAQETPEKDLARLSRRMAARRRPAA